MSKSNNNPADPFKKALAEATRAMAADSELAVAYSIDPPGLSNDTARLPQVSRRMTRQEVLLSRGTADAYALRTLSIMKQFIIAICLKAMKQKKYMKLWLQLDVKL